jgi:hypothetical protein
MFTVHLDSNLLADQQSFCPLADIISLADLVHILHVSFKIALSVDGDGAQLTLKLVSVVSALLVP